MPWPEGGFRKKSLLVEAMFLYQADQEIKQPSINEAFKLRKAMCTKAANRDNLISFDLHTHTHSYLTSTK